VLAVTGEQAPRHGLGLWHGWRATLANRVRVVTDEGTRTTTRSGGPGRRRDSVLRNVALRIPHWEACASRGGDRGNGRRTPKWAASLCTTLSLSVPRAVLELL